MKGTSGISVVVTTYNQNTRALAMTLESVIEQSCDNVEIIIADDCSKVDPSDFLRNLFKEHSFTNYSIVRSPNNVGTVANLIRGLSTASFDLVKPLSPGDALFNPSTLSNISSFVQQTGSKIGFGRIVSYLPDATFSPYRAPQLLEFYQDNNQDSRSILQSQILDTDWIPGCCLFYERTLMLSYLKELTDAAHVKYCEDLACPLFAADGIRIDCLNQNILWYEMGTGISTSGGTSSVKRMYQDHHNFYEYLMTRIPDKALAKRASRAFSLREFIALRTPFYRFAQKLKQTQYSGTATDLSELTDADIRFFQRINGC